MHMKKDLHKYNTKKSVKSVVKSDNIAQRLLKCGGLVKCGSASSKWSKGVELHWRYFKAWKKEFTGKKV